jgi:hypothetical protein
MCHHKSGCCKTGVLQHDRMVGAPGVANPPPRVRPPPWPSGVDWPPPRAKKMGLALGGGRSTPMDQGVASATPSFLFFFFFKKSFLLFFFLFILI